jgi:hypothetical protein
MRHLVLSFLFACSFLAPLSAQDGLRYRIQVWFRDEVDPVETRFVLQTLPAEHSNNHVQKPRLVPWELRSEREQGSPGMQVMLMNRARRLLFLSSPTTEASPEPLRLSFQGRALPVWRLAVPKALDAVAVLVEVEPKLLALCDLSARFKEGEVARLEMHLEGAGKLAVHQPAEEGTALLAALQRWSKGQD